MLSRSLVLSLILSLTFWRYEASEVPALYQVLYFSLKLYTVVRAVSIVLMELTILGVIPCGGIQLHLSWPPQELLVSESGSELDSELDFLEI